MNEVYDFSTFSNKSADLCKLLIEVEKYKAYMAKQHSVEFALKYKDIVSGNSLSMFGSEIFQFWLAAIRVQSVEQASFLKFADDVGIPVRDRDLGPNALSWLGRGIYSVWCEAIKD